MALQLPPHEYVDIDYDFILDFLEKKYKGESNK